MKELDFDELDRAVNSLMTNASKTPPPPKKDVEQTLTITPTIKSDDAPSLDMLDTKMSQINGQPQSATETASTPTPVAASKSAMTPAPRPSSSSVAARRGRFMDMVRPGATQPVTPAAPTPVSRQGTTIEPSRPLVNDIIPPSAGANKTDVPVAPTKSDEPVAEQIHTDIEPDTSGNNSEWPDPLDMADTPKKDVQPSTTTSKPSGSIFGDEPLSSPFLPDTRVEKRPLGGVQPVQDDVNEPSTPTTGASDTAELQEDGLKEDDHKTASKQLPADPVKMADDMSLPEELSGDVMALESDANTMAMPASSEKAAVVANQLDALKPDAKDNDVDDGDTPPKEAPKVTKSVTEDSGEPAVQPIVPTGPISIPQQYREEPSTGDKESGAIYDTDTYHQPLAHPKKKKSGWMWVIWIVLFLVVGAAGGAALFFLGVF